MSDEFTEAAMVHFRYCSAQLIMRRVGWSLSIGMQLQRRLTLCCPEQMR